MEPSDADLIEQIKRGSSAAFEILYRRHREWIVSIAFRFCGNRDDALDVLQDTFAYVWRKMPGFELRSQFRTFLYPVVKHLALSRKSGPRAEVPELEARATSPDAKDLLVGLPDEQREIVWLRFVDGLDLKDIAEVLEIPLGTVKSRLHAALQFLRSKR